MLVCSMTAPEGELWSHVQLHAQLVLLVHTQSKVLVELLVGRRAGNAPLAVCVAVFMRDQCTQRALHAAGCPGSSVGVTVTAKTVAGIHAAMLLLLLLPVVKQGGSSLASMQRLRLRRHLCVGIARSAASPLILPYTGLQLLLLLLMMRLMRLMSVLKSLALPRTVIRVVAVGTFHGVHGVCVCVCGGFVSRVVHSSVIQHVSAPRCECGVSIVGRTRQEVREMELLLRLLCFR